MSNQAASLTEILERVFVARRDKTLREAWAAEFEISPTDTGSLFYLLSKVDQSLKEVKTTLLSMPGFDSSIVANTLSDMSTAICYPNLDVAVAGIAGFFNDQVRLSLKIASSFYSRQEINPHIPPDQLTQIKTEIDSLFEFINASELDPDLQLILLDLVETMRRAVAEFQIRGNQSLQDVLDQSLGRLIRVARATESNPLEIPAFSKTLAVLSLIDKALSIAQRAQPYLPFLGTLIPALAVK